MAAINPTTLLRRLSSAQQGERLSQSEHQSLDDDSRALLRQFVARHKRPVIWTRAARAAFLRLGAACDRASWSLADYDHERWGPYLGVSDEGSAARAIRDAAAASPKAQVFHNDATIVGLALDAERLGAVGEVPVGPEEYADIWLECTGRLLTSTNVGTRANIRLYKHEPVVRIAAGPVAAAAKAAIAELQRAFEPFLKTLNGEPRPLTVLVEEPKRPPRERLELLKRLASAVRRGAFTSKSHHRLGLLVKVQGGEDGGQQALAGLDLAHRAGIAEVALDGPVHGQAALSISRAGLLNLFAPGLLGPILRKALKLAIQVRPRNTVDAETVARGIWSALSTARGMGLHLGKYGLHPLTLEESEVAVELIQRWFPDWAAAPVFFVDQGLVSRQRVDVGHDVARGLETWLRSMARLGVRVVLIDTVDKAGGWKLLRTARRAKGVRDKGLLSMGQVERLHQLATRLSMKVLWAGGLGLRDVYEMGRIGAFGIYVTSTASEAVVVPPAYARDPGLFAVKEPSFEGVLQTKLVLEAGFWAGRLQDKGRAARIKKVAQDLCDAAEAKDKPTAGRLRDALCRALVSAWKQAPARRRRGRKGTR